MLRRPKVQFRRSRVSTRGTLLCRTCTSLV
nr:MAG TPA: SR1 protein [Caudoviricetes sp.]